MQEFFGAPLRQLNEQVASDFGFHILVTRTEVGGYCADCRNAEPAEDSQAAAAGKLPVAAPKARARRRPKRAKK